MRLRLVIAAIVGLALLLVLVPAGATTKCYGPNPKVGLGPHIEGRTLVQEHKLVWGFCVPEIR